MSMYWFIDKVLLIIKNATSPITKASGNNSHDGVSFEKLCKDLLFIFSTTK